VLLSSFLVVLRASHCISVCAIITFSLAQKFVTDFITACKQMFDYERRKRP